MARSRSGAGLLIGLSFAAGGVALVALARSSRAAAPPTKREDSRGAEDTAERPDSNSPSADTPHAIAFRKALADFASRTKAAANEKAQLESEKLEAGKVAAAATSTIGALAVSIPTIGPIIAAAAALFAAMFKAAGYGAYFPTVSVGLATGYYRGSYFFKEVPIYGPAIDELVDKIRPISLVGDARQLDAFVALCKAFPEGPPVESVDVLDQGDYQYRFNLTNPGDLSEAARAAEQVRWMQVYDPADITPTGPRGFDPKDPWGWKVPGERKSRFDSPAVKVEPTNKAAGL